MSASTMKGFQRAGDLDDLSGKSVPRPIPSSTPTPIAASTGTPTPTPKSASPFMRAGDLISAADGGHRETKGASWDDYALSKPITTIGRNSKCDLVINHPGISSEHARISFQNGRYILTDSRSEAGTYINGKPVTQPVLLTEKDLIALGSTNFVFSGGRLLYCKTDDPKTRSTALRTIKPSERPVILHTNIQSKKVRNNNGPGMRELIRDIRLDVREGSLVAILGTSGAGKSVLMNCMNGMDLAGVQGEALYREVDLIHNFDQVKYLIGSVPQQKVLHPTFTPEEEFMEAALLRLPADTTRREIRDRVDQTLNVLSINGVRKNRISKLSGGEMTRVNLGIELVADRDLLCLDEPDQGLSPNVKHELFQLLQSLAHDHCKTILTIIHDVSDIELFDQVIMITKLNGVGRLAFSGAPSEIEPYFGVEIRQAYSILEQHPERYVR